MKERKKKLKICQIEKLKIKYKGKLNKLRKKIKILKNNRRNEEEKEERNKRKEKIHGLVH
jgi:hypothetical protein